MIHLDAIREASLFVINPLIIVVAVGEIKNHSRKCHMTQNDAEARETIGRRLVPQSEHKTVFRSICSEKEIETFFLIEFSFVYQPYSLVFD